MAFALMALSRRQTAARASQLWRAAACAVGPSASERLSCPAVAERLLSGTYIAISDKAFSCSRGLLTLPFAATKLYGMPPAGERAISGSAVSAQSQEPFASNPLHQPAVPSDKEEASTTAGTHGPRQAFCYLRKIPMSPTKLNMAAKLVRGMHVQDAMIQMDIRGEKKSAKYIRDALKSAYFNAINNHSMDADKLKVAECFVGKGRHLKRTMIHGMGRSAMMLKKRSHLTVKLVEDGQVIRQTHVVKPLLERTESARP